MAVVANWLDPLPLTILAALMTAAVGSGAAIVDALKTRFAWVISLATADQHHGLDSPPGTELQLLRQYKVGGSPPLRWAQCCPNPDQTLSDLAVGLLMALLYWWC